MAKLDSHGARRASPAASFPSFSHIPSSSQHHPVPRHLKAWILPCAPVTRDEHRTSTLAAAVGRGAASQQASERSRGTPPKKSFKSSNKQRSKGHEHRSEPGQGRQQGRAERSEAPVHVGQVLELDCARLALEGKGVCLLPPTGFVVLVERTLPGERVTAEVVAVKRGYAEARKLASLAPHRHAVAPPCPHFGPCGGCTLQSLEYGAQLAEKRNQVDQTLRRVGRLGPALDALAAGGPTVAVEQPAAKEEEAAQRAGAAAAAEQDVAGAERGPAVNNVGVAPGSSGGAVADAVGCREPFGYRNKMTFHFSSRCWTPPDEVADRNALGFLRPGTPDVVLPVAQQGCLLQASRANVLLARVDQLVSEHGLLPYNHRSGKGFLKHLVIRRSSGAAAPAPVAAAAPGPSASVAGSEGGPAAAASTRASSPADGQQQEEEFMVVFGVTHGPSAQLLKPVAEALAREFPELVSIVAWQVPPPPPPPRGAPAAGKTPAGRTAGDRSRGRDRGDRAGRQPVSAAAAGTPAGGDVAGDGDGLSLTGFADGADSAEADGADTTLLHGRPYIHDRIGGLTFRISPSSFFQTNSRQAEVLYDIVRQAAGLRPGAVDTVLDLYCGTGTIGLSLAADCRTVVGVDVVESAVSDARVNAALNGVTNATFLSADVDQLSELLPLPADTPSAPIPQTQLQHEAVSTPVQPLRNRTTAAAAAATTRGPEAQPQAASALAPDVVVVDPARAGLSPGAVAYLVRCGARRVVYVSCNVATQARDLDRLCNGPGAAFRLVSVQPVDMFPHTDHVETVAVLDRR